MGLMSKASISKSKAFLLLVFIVAASLLAILLIPQSNQRNQHKDSTGVVKAKTKQLDQKQNTTCQQVVSELGNISSDSVREYKTKQNLLERQVDCFADQLQYDKAIPAAEKLKALYLSRGSSEAQNVTRIETVIKEMKLSQQQHQEAEKRNNKGG